MNQRIKQLSKQAGDYVNEVYTGPVRSKTPGKIWEDGHIGWHTQFNEKFAELIIKECLAQVRDEVQYITDWDKADQVITEVKKHFGIEE